MDGKKCAPASAGLRIANYIIDSILQFFFAGILSLIFAIFVHDLFKIGVFFYCISILQIYYIFFEGTWQHTPGKWITGTKVVRKDGRMPTFGQILGRSFSRLVPFEIFSFLVGKNPRGWHDRFSGTVVVANEWTTEDVAAIDYEQLKKERSFKWLYIVLGIWLGIILLSIIVTVVLGSLSKAQAKAQDAKIVSAVSSMPAQALQWNPQDGPQPQDFSTDPVGDGTDTEGTLFTDNLPDNSLFSLIQKLPPQTYYFYGSDDKLPSDNGKWFFATTVSKDDYICVDSTGAINRVTKPGEDLQWSDVFPHTVPDMSCN